MSGRSRLHNASVSSGGVLKFRNVLVVCIGNICRSPMAEAVLRQRTSGKNGDIRWHRPAWARSSDTRHNHHAIDLMAERGLDISPAIARASSRLR